MAGAAAAGGKTTEGLTRHGEGGCRRHGYGDRGRLRGAWAASPVTLHRVTAVVMAKAAAGMARANACDSGGLGRPRRAALSHGGGGLNLT